MKIKLHLAILTVFYLFFSSNLCVAQTTHSVTADRVGKLKLISVNSGDSLFLKVTSGSSYCCEVQLPNDQIRFGTTDIGIFHDSGSTTITGRHAGDDEPILADTFNRLCFVTPQDLSFPGAVLSLGSVVGLVNDVPVQCYETTLFGGFNTSVTDFNFLELNNTLTKLQALDSKTISGKITAINTVPNPDIVVINNLSFTVEAGSRLDVDIHQTAGVGAFGPVKVAHNGAPGALKGIVSQYNIVSTTPLDFSPVLQDVLQTRANLAGARK